MNHKEDGDDKAETSAGVGPDEPTAVVPDAARTEQAELAWSADDELDGDEPADLARQSWGFTWGRAAVLLACAGVVALVIGVVGYVWMAGHRDAAPPLPRPASSSPVAASPAPPPAQPQPTLDGAYQIVYDVNASTYRGWTELPAWTGAKTIWWAWRSGCQPAGCVANGVKLDDTDHSVASAKNETDSLSYTDGQWTEKFPVSIPHPSSDPGCTESTQWVLRPQPDGTLAGTQTTTIVGSCASAGNVTETPIVALRIGPVPAGLLGTH